MDVVVAQFPEIGPFRDVLPDEFVGVLDRSFLPRGVAVGEVHGGLQRLGYLPVTAELHAVVCGYRQHVPPVRPEQPGDRLRHGVGLAALRQTLHDEVVPAPLAQGQYRTLLSLPHYQVHLPVTEPPPVRLRQPAKDAYPTRYVRDPCRTATLPVAPVLHLVPAMAPQIPAHCAPVDSYLPGNGRLCPFLLYSQIDCVSLLPGQLVIDDNTKLIDPRGRPKEILGGLIIFTREYYQSICIEENGVENKFS